MDKAARKKFAMVAASASARDGLPSSYFHSRPLAGARSYRAAVTGSDIVRGKPILARATSAPPTSRWHMSQLQPPAEFAPVRWRGDILLLVAFFGALYFFALGRLELVRPDEPRTAEIAREMIVTGDWVTPRLNDTRYFEKPPLVYWTTALSQLAFGPGEAALRLTPTLFGLAGILLTYAAARRLHGREAGLAAAIVLGTSILYFGIARLLQLDMALSTLMSAALFSFILGVRAATGTARRWFFRALYAAAALATLTKGPIGFLIPGGVMFVWLLVFNQWHRLRPLHLPEGIVIFLLIAGPWHMLVAQRNPEWAHFYFVHEHWTRFTTTT